MAPFSSDFYEFGPSVMEPSVDGAVIRPTPDEYEDGEEAV